VSSEQTWSHGYYRYQRGCRCEVCRRGKQAAQERAMAKARSGVTRMPHGTRSGYVLGCRCEACSDANRAACRRYRATGQYGSEVVAGAQGGLFGDES
jgi:hypothetical protein